MIKVCNSFFLLHKITDMCVCVWYFFLFDTGFIFFSKFIRSFACSLIFCFIRRRRRRRRLGRR